MAQTTDLTAYAFYLPRFASQTQAMNLASHIEQSMPQVMHVQIAPCGTVILFVAYPDIDTVYIERKLREWQSAAHCV